MKIFDLLIIIILGFLIFKEISSLRKENKKIKDKFDQLAQATGNQDLSFNFLDDKLKDQLIKLENQGRREESLLLLIENSKMDSKQAREYLSKLMEEE